MVSEADEFLSIVNTILNVGTEKNQDFTVMFLTKFLKHLNTRSMYADACTFVECKSYFTASSFALAVSE